NIPKIFPTPRLAAYSFNKAGAAEPRYLTLMEGYLSSKLFRIRPTIDPPVRVPYQTTSPSFFAFSTDGGVCWANAAGVTSGDITRANAIMKTIKICTKGSFTLL